MAVERGGVDVAQGRVEVTRLGGTNERTDGKIELLEVDLTGRVDVHRVPDRIDGLGMRGQAHLGHVLSHLVARDRPGGIVVKPAEKVGQLSPVASECGGLRRWSVADIGKAAESILIKVRAHGQGQGQGRAHAGCPTH